MRAGRRKAGPTKEKAERKPPQTHRNRTVAQIAAARGVERHALRRSPAAEGNKTSVISGMKTGVVAPDKGKHDQAGER